MKHKAQKRRKAVEIAIKDTDGAISKWSDMNRRGKMHYMALAEREVGKVKVSPPKGGGL